MTASGSIALLGDALHSAADALTAVPLWLAFPGTPPPTRRFTFGYGKSEDVAGVVILLLVFGAAAFAGYEAIDRLVDEALPDRRQQGRPRSIRTRATPPQRQQSRSPCGLEA